MNNCGFDRWIRERGGLAFDYLQAVKQNLELGGSSHDIDLRRAMCPTATACMRYSSSASRSAGGFTCRLTSEFTGPARFFAQVWWDDGLGVVVTPSLIRLAEIPA